VSIFLRDKVQHNNTGRFVLPVGGPLPVDTEVPGKIRSALQAAYMLHCRNNNNNKIIIIIITFIGFGSQEGWIQQTFKHTQDGLTDEEKIILNVS